MLGTVAAGAPIEAVENNETISVPDDFIRRDNTFCLRVKGDSMIEDGIRDGDYIIVEGRDSADNGETVVALIGNEATVKKFYRESGGQIRLQPANSADATDHGGRGRPGDSRRRGRPDASLPLWRRNLALIN